jgi:anti-anti-sigma regulatory factor
MMSGKKSKKQAMDYDPLAWLDAAEQGDAGEQAPASSRDTGGFEPVRQDAGQAAASDGNKLPGGEPQSPAAKQDSKTVDEALGYGFFDQDSIEVKQETVHDMPENSGDTTQAYGFFDDDQDPGQQETSAVKLDISGQVIETGAELTIRSVAEFKEMLERSLAEGNDVCISAQGLRKIDTAGLQLLYSLKLSLAKTNQSIQWVQSSNMINDGAELIGMPPLADAVADEGESFGFFDEQGKAAPAASAEEESEGFGFF